MRGGNLDVPPQAGRETGEKGATRAVWLDPPEAMANGSGVTRGHYVATDEGIDCGAPCERSILAGIAAPLASGQQVGLVDVAIGNVTILRDVHVGLAANVIAQVQTIRSPRTFFLRRLSRGVSSRATPRATRQDAANHSVHSALPERGRAARTRYSDAAVSRE